MNGNMLRSIQTNSTKIVNGVIITIAALAVGVLVLFQVTKRLSR